MNGSQRRLRHLRYCPRHRRRWAANEGGKVTLVRAQMPSTYATCNLYQRNRSDFRIFDVTPATLITIQESPGAAVTTGKSLTLLSAI